MGDAQGQLAAGGAVDPKRPEPEELLSGRTLDLDIQAIQKVLKWGAVRKWIDIKPEIDWDTLADEPRELRLQTGAEVEALCSANLVTQVELDALPPRQRHLRAIQTPRAQLFSDYLRLRGPTGSGAMFISRTQMQKPAAVNLPMIATWIFTRNWKTICS